MQQESTGWSKKVLDRSTGWSELDSSRAPAGASRLACGVQAVRRQKGGKRVGVRRSRPSPPCCSTDLAMEEQTWSSMWCAGAAVGPGVDGAEPELDAIV
jgi:hypothetical protein